jgi:hypothetical protein
MAIALAENNLGKINLTQNVVKDDSNYKYSGKISPGDLIEEDDGEYND